MNTTDTSQMAHQNPIHHQPPLMESDETNHKINQSSSSSLSTTRNEETQEPRRRLPLGASDSDKKQSVSLTEKQQQEQEQQEHQEQEAGDGDDNGRERLKRHQREVAGRVWIPEIWGQEDLLKDWIDCSSFDSCLVPTGISSARAALVQEARRATSGGALRVENRCLILR